MKYKEIKVSAHLANQIEKLTEALKAEVGCDFSFRIHVFGHLLAANNAVDGIIKPSIKE